MEAPQNFRSAFNGFNREDVVNYISFISTKHEGQLNELRSEAEELRAQLTEQGNQAKIAETLKCGLEELVKELESCKAELTRLENEVKERDEVIQAREQELDAMNADLIAREEELETRTRELSTVQKELSVQTGEMAAIRAEKDAWITERDRLNQDRSILEKDAQGTRDAISGMERELETLQTQNAEKDAEIARLKAALEQNAGEFAELRGELERAKVLPVNTKKTDFFGRWAEELNAYRRAESCERRARERVNEMYDRANGALAEASVRVEQTVGQITDLASKVETDVALLLKAMVDSENTLADAAVMLGAIRPDMD